jgi:tetratricopeptide (TPR) repeat protein
LTRHATWLLPLLAVLAWARSLANGFVWDDRMLIADNPLLVGPDAVRAAFGDFWAAGTAGSGYWRPLVTLSYVAERAAWGLDPMPYHVTNVALHAAVVGLLTRWVQAEKLGAAALAGVAWFAVHPAFAENVAWISGRTDTMAMMFSLVAILAGTEARPTTASRAASAVALALALLSKEVAVAVPFVIVARDALAGRPIGEAIRDRVGDLGVIASYAVVRTVLVGIPIGTDDDLAGASKLVAVPHVLGLLVLPWLGRVEYGAGLPVDPLVPAAVAGAALAVGLAAVAKDDRAVALLVVAGALFFLPNAVVVLGRGVVGERLSYVAGAFWLPALALAFARMPKGAAWAVLAVLLATTLQKSAWYRSDLTLFEKAAAAPHPSPRTRLNYGIALHDQGRLVEAHAELREASRASIDQAPYMLGLLYDEIGCQDLAEREYREALRVNPGYGAAAGNLAGLLLMQGRSGDARQVIEATLAVKEDPTLRRNLGVIDQVRGRRVPDPAECVSSAGVDGLLRSHEHLAQRAQVMERMGRMESARALSLAASQP